ncbi:MAG: PQQ-dependent sugar dehydrogenase [Bacteroidia bacterium]|nr:PQQ-dependent sugar dehydrogenase [Bacteroidia bacterium]
MYYVIKNLNTQWLKKLNALLLVLLFSPCQKICAQVLPPFFNDALVSNNWNQPLGIAFDKNKKLYVWEKAGYVWIVDTNGNKAATPLLDLHEEVGNWVDHGLNSFALHPNFLNNGYIYCFYTVDRHYLLNYGTPAYKSNKNEYGSATIARVVRFTVDMAAGGNTIVPNSKLILIGADKKNGIVITHTSHSGGTLLFGADTSLLISTGDGASFNGIDSGSSVNSFAYQALQDTMLTTANNVGAFKAQMLSSYNGKVLRIDPITGLGLSSNPYFETLNPNSVKSKIWCTGLRNPFRMAIKPNSGSNDITAGDPGVLFIGDVGWFNYEELNISKIGGENFGWPIFEGLVTNPDYLNLSVQNLDAANPLYNGSSCMRPYFMYKELLKQATLDVNDTFVNPCNSNLPLNQHPTWYHTRPIIDYRHNTNQTRTGSYVGNNASTINLGDSNATVQGVSFAGNASLAGVWYNDNRMPVEYQGKYFHLDYGSQWMKRMNFDTDNNLLAIDSFYTEMNKSSFVTVNPKDGCLNYIAYQTNEIRKICYTQYINNPPVPVISVDKRYGPSPVSIVFNASKSYDFETRVNLSYLWKFGDGYSSTGKIAGHTFVVPNGVPSSFWVSLKVTDSLGLSKTDSMLIFVNNTPPQVSISSLNDNDYYATSYQSVVNLESVVIDNEHHDSTLTYGWQVVLNHNNHYHPGPIDNDKITSAILDPEGCNNEIFYYAIILRVTDPLGLSNTDTVKLYPACSKPKAKIATSNTTICKGSSITLIDSSTVASTYKWITNGGTPSISYIKSPTITYHTPGTYNVKLVVTNPEGADSVTKSGLITVGGYANNSIVATIDTICNTQNTTLDCNVSNASSYKWFKNGTLINGVGTQTQQVNEAASYSVSVTDINGCTGTATKVIAQRAVIPQITSNKNMPICFNDSVILTGTNTANTLLTWKRNGKPISGANATSYTASQSGSFLLQTNQAGCIGKSNTIQVLLSPVYTIAADGPLTFCSNDSVVISCTNPQGTYAYQWKKNNVNITGATSSAYVAKSAGNYIVIVTDVNGCTRKSNAFKVVINCKESFGYNNFWGNISIQPNPVISTLGLSFDLTQDANVTVGVYDMIGKQQLQTTAECVAGSNLLSIDLEKLGNGIYQLIISHNNGTQKSVHKFVKN